MNNIKADLDSWLKVYPEFDKIFKMDKYKYEDSDIIYETASVGGMSAGAVATVVKPIANDKPTCCTETQKVQKD